MNTKRNEGIAKDISWFTLELKQTIIDWIFYSINICDFHFLMFFLEVFNFPTVKYQLEKKKLDTLFMV